MKTKSKYLFVCIFLGILMLVLSTELQGPLEPKLTNNEENNIISDKSMPSKTNGDSKVDVQDAMDSSEDKKPSEAPDLSTSIPKSLLDKFGRMLVKRAAADQQLQANLNKLIAEREAPKEKDYSEMNIEEVLEEEVKKALDQAEEQSAIDRAKLAYSKLIDGDLGQLYIAIKEFKELAERGVSTAHLGLAFLHSIGLGGANVSQPLALIHYTLAALGGDHFAQMALGYRYSFGINVPLNCEVSLSFYKRVAHFVASKITFSNGPLVHRVRLLDELENSGSQEAELVDYYQLLADKGDVQSQIGLGQLYYQGGKATQRDLQKALEYFTLAANAGNAIGYAFLGKLYLEGGDQIVKDYEAAFSFFKKAADLGDPIGQSGLGVMYLFALGVPQDKLKAFNYFTQASDQGWVDGQLHLGNMYFTGNGVKLDYKLAFKYFNLASQSGHVLAYYNLGLMHAHGLGMLRSCPAAVEFFKNVAERGPWSQLLMQAYNDYKSYNADKAFIKYALLAEAGYEVGQCNCAFLLDRNEVTLFDDRHEDLIRAFYYWKRAALQGNSAAQVKLGDYYYYGWGTSIDFESAASLYRKASEQHYNAQAMFNLGYMHEQGLGMKKDLHLAKRLYDLAAETNADAKIPVSLALFKLNLFAKIDSLRESQYKFLFHLDDNIVANWDLYVITLLTLLLGTIMYTRRPLQHQQEGQNNANREQRFHQQNTEETSTATSSTPLVQDDQTSENNPTQDAHPSSTSTATDSNTTDESSVSYKVQPTDSTATTSAGVSPTVQNEVPTKSLSPSVINEDERPE